MKTHFCLMAIGLLVGLSACTSAFKQQCENRDWFAYGKEVALQGRRLSGDDLILKCRKAGAEFSDSQVDVGFKTGRELYCHPNQALITGKKGYVFNTSMCGESENSLLMRSYLTGVEFYCQPDSAYRLGTEGGIYSKICRKELEPAFMDRYLCGRRYYLIEEQKKLQVLMQKEDRQFLALEQARSSVSSRLIGLPSPQLAKRTRYNSFTEKVEEYYESDDPYSALRSSLTGQYYELSEQMSKSHHQLRDATEKLAAVGNELKGMAEQDNCPM